MKHMAPRVILHAGVHKTGSTAIQHFLRSNRATLLKEGILIPLSGSTPGGNHFPLIDAIRGRGAPSEDHKTLSAFLKETERHAGCAVIITAEDMEQLLLKARLKKVLNFFSRITRHIAILYYVRPHIPWVNSIYVQHVKTFSSHAPFHPFLESWLKEPRSKYTNLLYRDEHPVETMIRPFTEQIRRNGIVGDFLSAIGYNRMSELLGAMERRANESIGPCAISAARSTRVDLETVGTMITSDLRAALRKELRLAIKEEASELPYFGVTPSHRKLIESAVSDDREVFAEAAWGRTWDEVFEVNGEMPAPNDLDLSASEEQVAQCIRLRSRLISFAQTLEQ